MVSRHRRALTQKCSMSARMRVRLTSHQAPVAAEHSESRRTEYRSGRHGMKSGPRNLRWFHIPMLVHRIKRIARKRTTETTTTHAAPLIAMAILTVPSHTVSGGSLP